MAARRIADLSIYDVSVVSTRRSSHARTFVVSQIRSSASSLRVSNTWGRLYGFPAKLTVALRSVFYLFRVATY